MSGFTPGPWASVGSCVYVPTKNGSLTIGRALDWTETDAVKDYKETDANAALFAAAPALLEACELTLKRLSEQNRDADAGMRLVLANAIAQAQGKE